jgi:hypothetical protein
METGQAHEQQVGLKLTLEKSKEAQRMLRL